MTKGKQIEKLFKRCFEFDDFTKQCEVKTFECLNRGKCHIKRGEPRWTAYLGSPDTYIMAVAEAPSRKGTFIAGNFADVPNRKKSPIHIVKEFVEDYYGTIPYFTDLIKCGVTKQKNKNDVLKTRAELCINYFLLEEIRIIKPRIILCIGGLAQKLLRRYKDMDKISKGIKLIPLLHYGSQAQLNLSPDEKKDIIWKWQVGKLTRKELGQKLSKLSYFNKKPEIF